MTTTPQPRSFGLLRCRCGCGSVVREGSNYRPGHDARHVSQLFRQMLAAMSHTPIEGVTVYQRAMRELPTVALRAKFRSRIIQWQRNEVKQATDYTPSARLIAARGDRWVLGPDEYRRSLVHTLVARMADLDMSGTNLSTDTLALLLAGAGWTMTTLINSWS